MYGNRQEIQSAAAATGNGKNFGVMDWAHVVFSVTGTFVGTVTFESSLDGANWTSIQVYNLADGVVSTTTTTTGLYGCSVAALGDVRARISAYTSGSISVLARGVDTSAGVSLADIDIAGAEEVTIAAGEAHIGEVGAKTLFPEVDCSLDTNIYASGDVLFDTQEMTGATRVHAGTGTVLSFRVIDKDDQGKNFDLYFLKTNVSMGTENSAPNISDANAGEIFGYVAVDSWEDLGGCQVATLTNVGLGIESAAATDSIFLAGISKGTGTYTALGITIKVTVLAD